MASPIPRVAPVTSATSPSSRLTAFSHDVGLQDVARQMEAPDDASSVALEAPVLVLDDDGPVVADGVQGGEEAVPAHLAETRAAAAPASRSRPT